MANNGSEVIEVGRISIPVVADYAPLERQLKQIEQSAKRSGKATGDAFGDGTRELGRFNVETKTAIQGLSGLAMIALHRASGAMKGFLGFITRTTSSLVDLGALGALRVSRALDSMAESTRDANGELSTMGKAGKVAATGLETTAKAILIVSGVITGLQIAAAGAAASFVILSHRAAAEFAPAWNRVLTALGEGGGKFHHLRGEVSQLASSLGVEGTEAANTFYEALSVMPDLAKEPTRALELLRVALEAGTTGFTDSATAVKAISNIINAFGLEVEEAERISDKFFTTQGLGDTTFLEMAESMDKVAGLAASLGVSFEDIFALMATMTQTIGTPTEQLATQVRSAMINIIKPTAMAKEQAERLGVEFSAAALEAKGLNGFLLELVEVTKGDPDVLAQFFGSDEALVLVTGLAQQTEVLRQRIQDTGDATGEHKRNVDRMTDSWAKQKEILGQQMPGILRGLGFEFEGMGVKAVRAINRILFAMRGLDAEGKKIALEKSTGDWMEQANREEQARVDSMLGPRRPDQTPWWRRRNQPAATPPQGPRLLPGLFSAAPGAPAPETTTIEDAKKKVEVLRTQLQAAAAAQLAATGNTEAYEQALRNVQQRVNDLVLEQVSLLRVSGATDAAINELAAEYSALAKEVEATVTAEERAAESASESLRQRVLAFNALGPLRGMGVSTAAEAPADVEGQLQRIFSIDQELRSIEKEIADSRAAAPAQIAAIVAALEEERTSLLANVATIREQWDRLPQMRQQLTATVGLIGELHGVDLGAEGFVLLSEAIDTVTRATQEAAAADAELVRAQLSGDRERIADALRRQQDALKRVAAAAARALRAFEAGGEQGAISQERLNELLAQMVALLKEAGIEVENLTAKESKWEGFADTFAGVARGVLSVADALGIMDDRGRKALQGVVDIADAAAGIAANPWNVGAWAQGIGGAVSLLTSAFGDSPAEKERREILKQNTAALERLRMELSGFRVTTASLSEARRSAEALKTAYGNSTLYEGGVSVANAARGIGITGPQLRELAESLGITIFDEKGRLVRGALDELIRAIDLAAKGLVGFRDTVDDQRFARELEADIFDRTDDAAGKLQREFELLAKYAPELLKQFGLSGTDVSTSEGRTALEAAVRAIFTAFQNGTLNLGNLTREEFLEILRGIEGSLDEIGTGGVTAGGAVQTRLGVNITEIQASQLLALESTQVFHLAAIHALLANGAPARGAIAMPSAASLSLSAGGVTIGRMDVTVEVPAGALGAERDQLIAAGRTLGGAFGDSLNAKLQRLARGQGIDPARLETRPR